MKMITVTLQGEEVQAALLNPETAKRYEDGLDVCINRINTAAECGKGSEGLREQCQAVIDYVADIFGNDGAKKVFGKQTDVLTCLDVLEEMLDVYAKQVAPMIREKTKSLKEKMEVKGDV